MGRGAASTRATGVTSFAPTFVTAPLPDLAAALESLPAGRVRSAYEPAARVLGAHLEGPFLSPKHRGAHDAALLRDPSVDAVDLLLAAGGADRLALVTLAPERPRALAAVARLVAAGVVVSVGHSDATAAQVEAAADAGATLVTHLFNAQRGLHHREPGVVGAALDDDRLSLGLVVDLVHVAPCVVRLAFAAAGARVVLVSDATAASGMPPGRYRLGGADAVVSAPDEPPRRADGTLAGSAITLDAAVRLAISVGIDPVAALLAATRTPADTIGRGDLGRITPGAAADLVWWDDAWRVRRTWVAGRDTG